MNDHPAQARRRMVFRSLYLALCLVLILLKLLPLGIGSPGIPGPDLLLAITFAWVLRHPSAVPVVSIVLIFLLADFLLVRPPGLWTALVILLTERLRRYRLYIAQVPFIVEWTLFAGAVLILVFLERAVFTVLLVTPPTLGLALTYALMTAASYPVVVALSKTVFRLRKLRGSDPI